jgi:methyl-accepting chemotaxis protein
MLANVSSKMKITILVILVGLLSVVSSYFYSKYSNKELLQKSIENRKSVLIQDVNRMSKKKQEIGLTNVIGLSTNQLLMNAVISKDKEALDTILSDVAQTYKRNSNFKGIKVHIHDENLKSFHRSWKNKSGDYLGSFRFSLSKVKSSKRPFIGYELGRSGLMIRAIIPLIMDGQYYGSMEFIQGVGSLNRTNRKFKRDYLMVVKMEDINDIATNMKPQTKLKDNFMLANNKWFDQESVEFGKKLDMNKLIKDGHLFTKDKFVVIKPIKDVRNKVVGYHILGENLKIINTSINQLEKTSMNYMMLISILIIFIAILVLITIEQLIIKPLKNVIENLKMNNNSLEKAFESMSSTVSVLNDTSSSQAAIVEEVTANTNELRDSVISNSNNSNKTSELATQSLKLTQSGKDAIESVRDSMSDIDKSSSEISNITNTINEISFQTNLLALNAAVEAARAGEHGLGFAVVAEEVRALATRSANESSNIENIISNSDKQVEVGIDKTNNTVKVFDEIVTKIKDTNELISEVSISSQSQAESIQQLNNTIMSISEATQDIAHQSDIIDTNMKNLYQDIRNNSENIDNISSMVGK